jgi:hypothetical protein
MNAGRIDQRVTVEPLEEGQDEIGQPFSTWTPLFAVGAAVASERAGVHRGNVGTVRSHDAHTPALSARYHVSRPREP